MGAAFTAACVQMTSEREFAPNIAAAVAGIRAARDAGADFVALPENCTMIEPLGDAAMQKARTEAEHPALTAFAEAVRETGVWLLIGSLSIRRPNGKIANRSILMAPDGSIAARYDKLHRFDVQLANGESYRESDTVEGGEAAVLGATPWGAVGMTVCYDVRFPQLYRALAKSGATMLTVPSAFTETTGRAHWHILLRARAIETGCFVIAPAQWGVHAEGRRTYGHSLIVDPWGAVLADGGEGTGIVTATIDMARVEEARQRIPALDHDRPFDAPEPAPPVSAVRAVIARWPSLSSAQSVQVPPSIRPAIRNGPVS